MRPELALVIFCQRTYSTPVCAVWVGTGGWLARLGRRLRDLAMEGGYTASDLAKKILDAPGISPVLIPPPSKEEGIIQWVKEGGFEPEYVYRMVDCDSGAFRILAIKFDGRGKYSLLYSGPVDGFDPDMKEEEDTACQM